MKMKKILIILSLFIASYSFSQNSFEITQDVQSFTNGKQVDYQMIWKVDNDKAVLEIDYSTTGDMNIVLLPKDNTLYYYSKKANQENKQYYIIEDKEVNDDFAVFQSNNTIEIDGYKATKFIMMSKSKEVEFWFTEDLNIDIRTIATMFKGTEFEKIANELPLKGFILAYTVKENGRIITSVKLNKVNSTSFNPAVFNFPVGYTLYQAK